MKRKFLLPALLLLSAAASAKSHRHDSANVNNPLAGFVTRVVSATDFDINGSRVVLGEKTKLTVQGARAELMPYVGERVLYRGKRQPRVHTLEVTEIEFRGTAERKVAGFAIVEKVWDSASAGERLLQADGYTITIPAAVKPVFDQLLGPGASIQPNQWLEFRGTLRPDGRVIAESVAFRKNVVKPREERYRRQYERDPAAVNPEIVQGTFSKGLGVDPRKVPAYFDETMQKRIQRVGSALIPRYQRALAAGDPARIDFRFQLVDEPRWHTALASPNGIILVPAQFVETLTSDSQLAAVLALAIAEVIEKDAYRVLTTNEYLLLARSAGDVSENVILPIMGVRELTVNSTSWAYASRHMLLQSERVSLDLMHDAGYDVQQAPVAWWMMAVKGPKHMDEVAMPARTAYLYQVLGELWRQ